MVNRMYWNSIEDEVREWVITNWDKWEAESATDIGIWAGLGAPGTVTQLILPLALGHWDAGEINVAVSPSALRLVTKIRSGSLASLRR